MKKVAILALMVIVVSTLIFISISAQENYSKILPNYTHSHTKALCNDQNLCQDYEIFCQNTDLIRMSPITGAIIQFDSDWQDPRSEEIREKFC